MVHSLSNGWSQLILLMVIMHHANLAAQQFPEVPQAVSATGAALHLEPIPPSPNYERWEC